MPNALNHGSRASGAGSLSWPVLDTGRCHEQRELLPSTSLKLLVSFYQTPSLAPCERWISIYRIVGENITREIRSCYECGVLENKLTGRAITSCKR
ncbi:unnamed protein product [Pocillopora meandrina]|uniref:Uncharacterized protein n=1 Tax=Pocillopora meandrina TaxID=46732 RepID=A0AAU9X7E0_9CNID|nr:unnamed protein product [Pocillopora meandrina]